MRCANLSVGCWTQRIDGSRVLSPRRSRQALLAGDRGARDLRPHAVHSAELSRWRARERRPARPARRSRSAARRDRLRRSAARRRFATASSTRRCRRSPISARGRRGATPTASIAFCDHLLVIDHSRKSRALGRAGRDRRHLSAASPGRRARQPAASTAPANSTSRRCFARKPDLNVPRARPLLRASANIATSARSSSSGTASGPMCCGTAST